MNSRIAKCGIIIVTILSLLCSCSNSTRQKEVQSYDKYLILGNTETQYLDKIKNELIAVYAPKSKISKDTVKNMLSLTMTDECIKQFTEDGQNAEYEGQNIQCIVNQIIFAYGKHQKDGISRVIAAITVETDQKRWDFTLEMKLNKDGMIYEAMAY